MSTPKLKLELDALHVESFATDRGTRARGTVNANAARCGTNAADCDPITCGPSCIGPCTSDGAGVAVAEAQNGFVKATDPIVTDKSYLETCIFYTCAGCTTADPQYC